MTETDTCKNADVLYLAENKKKSLAASVLHKNGTSQFRRIYSSKSRFRIEKKWKWLIMSVRSMIFRDFQKVPNYLRTIYSNLTGFFLENFDLKKIITRRILSVNR